MRGFKQPINIFNLAYLKTNIARIGDLAYLKTNIARIGDLAYLKTNIARIEDYLLNLKDMTGQRLIVHRRKTFVLGFVSTAKSVLCLPEELSN